MENTVRQTFHEDELFLFIDICAGLRASALEAVDKVNKYFIFHTMLIHNI